jgi:hypothetical protein
VRICNSGLHAAPIILAALEYASGTILHEVELAEIVRRQHDKAVARRRRWLRRADMTWALVEFAEACAVRAAAHTARAARAARDFRDFRDVWVARSARNYARDAARAASDSRTAVRASTSGAARSAAWAAIRVFALDSELDAARDAGSLAVRTAEMAWQEDTLRLWFECLADDGSKKGDTNERGD